MQIIIRTLMLTGFTLSAAPAFAQDDDLEKTCKSNKSEFQVRLAACSTLLKSDAYADQAWVYERRGDAYEDNDQYTQAVSDYERALKIDPEYEAAFQGLTISFVHLEQPEDALLASEKLIAIDPDQAFNHFWRGRAYELAEMSQLAIAAYQSAIDLDGDYVHPVWWQAFQYRDGDQTELALAGFERTSQLRPFWTGPYRQMGFLHRNAENMELAARNFRTAIALDPNLKRNTSSVPDLTPRIEAPTLPPLAYAPPPEDLAMRYLQVVLPRDTREEMEVAIMAIAAWFSAPEEAKPEAKAFIIRRPTAIGDALRVGMELEAEENMDRFIAPGVALPDWVDTYRGILLEEVRPRGMDGPVFKVAYDGPQPSELWPLQVGKQLAGTGRFLLICPETFQFESMVLGCRIGMENVEMGTLEYSFIVDRVEQVQVPLGDFTTYVIRYRELSTSAIGGEERSREIENHWWIAPELNFWVQRTMQMGDKIARIMAVEKI